MPDFEHFGLETEVAHKCAALAGHRLADVVPREDLALDNQRTNAAFEQAHADRRSGWAPTNDNDVALQIRLHPRPQSRREAVILLRSAAGHKSS
jgi:hypothetical protein